MSAVSSWLMFQVVGSAVVRLLTEATRIKSDRPCVCFVCRGTMSERDGSGNRIGSGRMEGERR
jgi:hypothetical protein